MRKDRYDTLLKLNKTEAYKYKFMCKVVILFRVLSIIPLLMLSVLINGISIFKEIDKWCFRQIFDLDNTDSYFFWLWNWYWNKYLAPKYFNEWKYYWEMKEEYKEILSKIK